MNFEDLWNNKLKFISGTNYDICKYFWDIAQEEFLENSSNFDSWWDYQHTKKYMQTAKHAARWAWTIQQTHIDTLERDLETIATELGIDTNSINIKDLRTIIIDTLKNQKT
jgi:hypothetical protein